MRLSLFILGVFAAVICIEIPAEAQNGGWCAYYDEAFGGARICGFNSVWTTCAALAGTAHPVRTTSRPTTSGTEGTNRIDWALQLFDRSPPRLARNAALHRAQKV